MTMLTLVGLAISLASLSYYSAPWAATSAYPLVYVGAGTTCAAVGDLGCRLLARLPRSLVDTTVRRTLAGRRRAAWASSGLALLLAIVLAAATNADLVGDLRFLLTWWRNFGGSYYF